MKRKKISLWIINNISLHEEESRNEELANAGTHGLGILLSIAATILMVSRVLEGESEVSLTGVLVFGISMFLLYFSSTFYHISRGEVSKRVLRVLDHSTIYFLIAGTYTPIVLTIGGSAGWTIFGIEWALTLLGVIFTLLFWDRYGILHVLFYIFMGWMALFIWKPLVEMVDITFLVVLLSGGLSYTLGTIVYSLKNVPYHHAVWYLFVLAGSILMFLGVYIYIM